mmetsp:Transcript_8282/g.14567  ORF Transcript_8282/g.14567 Transcript_8282/m.14567 type:complete len:231 (+) Transcript_8282:2095-2787(+)
MSFGELKFLFLFFFLVVLPDFVAIIFDVVCGFFLVVVIVFTIRISIRSCLFTQLVNIVLGFTGFFRLGRFLWLLFCQFVFLFFGLLSFPSATSPSSLLGGRSKDLVRQILQLLCHNLRRYKVWHDLLPKKWIVHVKGGRCCVTCKFGLAHHHPLLIQPGCSLGSFDDTRASSLGQNAIDVICTELLHNFIIVVFQKSVCPLLEQLLHFLACWFIVVFILTKSSKDGLFQS